MLLAIQELEQRLFDVIVPLVPGFEREVLKASDCFPLRHRAEIIDIRASYAKFWNVFFVDKIGGSVDKRSGTIFQIAFPKGPL